MSALGWNVVPGLGGVDKVAALFCKLLQSTDSSIVAIEVCSVKQILELSMTLRKHILSLSMVGHSMSSTSLSVT